MSAVPAAPAPLVRDALFTVAAIAWLAYLAADLVHHALGHGALCLLQGGEMRRLSSTFVDCSRTGVAIDLAGPVANLVCGLAAVLVLRSQRLSPRAELFWLLLAGFNLMWFSGQLVFSTLSRTDDWAWMLHVRGDPPALRYGLMAAGVVFYELTRRTLSRTLARFAHPPGRVWRLAATAWFVPGVLAALTAVLDRHGLAAVWQGALPQSLLLSAGLLLAARQAGRAAVPAPAARAALAFSWGWLVTAALAAAASIAFLGPGVSLSG